MLIEIKPLLLPTTKLGVALVTLLKDAGYYSAVAAQAAIGTGLTFYDMLARTLDKIAKASASFATQTLGLLGIC
ncbi:hypothetical protein ACOBV9_18560 (plasmid) [Pseudoalteromonas espejiana]